MTGFFYLEGVESLGGVGALEGMSYSQFMGKVKANGIELNRKVLADLTMNHPESLITN